MTSSTVHISLEKSQILKGLAINPVIMIHIWAYLPGIYTTSRFQLFFISVDQLGRFCVPLFLVLSGYGLAIRYKDEAPAWWPFVKKNCEANPVVLGLEYRVVRVAQYRASMEVCRPTTNYMVSTADGQC